jgi:hypothetical protein
MATRDMKRPYPLPPERMSATERRAEVCGLLALGLIRLHQRENRQPAKDSGDIRLHYPGGACRHATSTQQEETA